MVPGVEMKRNIKRRVALPVQICVSDVGLDAAIIMHPKVYTRHTATF